MKLSLLAVALFFFCNYSLSQKDAPVVGNAIDLVQFLNKDYESVAPEIRGEQLIRDRAKVIDIFRSYLRQLELDEYNEKVNVALGNKKDKKGLLFLRDDKFHFYVRKKEKHDAFKKAQIRNSTGELTVNKKSGDRKTTWESALVDTLEGLSEERSKAQQEFFDAQYAVDSAHLVELKAIYSSNTYLNRALSEFIKKYQFLHNVSRDPFADQGVSATVQKGLPFIGGDLAFETVIEGLSRFLAERIKEELTTYVISKLQEWLDEKRYTSPIEELSILLPSTMEYIMEFEASQLLNFPDEIKQYVEKDLNNILGNAVGLRESSSIKRLVQLYPDIDFAFEALELIPQLKKIKHPVEFLGVLENSDNLNRWEDSGEHVRHNIANAINMAILLGRSFTTLQGGQLEFANLEDVDLYLDNNHFFQLYFGFLYQQDAKYYQVNFIVNSQKKIETYVHEFSYELNEADTLVVMSAFISDSIYHGESGGIQILPNLPIIPALNGLSSDVQFELVSAEQVYVETTANKTGYVFIQGKDTIEVIKKNDLQLAINKIIRLQSDDPLVIHKGKNNVLDTLDSLRRKEIRIVFDSQSGITISYAPEIIRTISSAKKELKFEWNSGKVNVYTFKDTTDEFRLPLGSIMQEFMTYYDNEKIVELNTARTYFETLFSKMGVQVKEVNSLATEIRKVNKRGNNVPLKMACDFVDGNINFVESLASTGDEIWGFLLEEIHKEKRSIAYAKADSRSGAIKYQLVFKPGNQEIDFDIQLTKKVEPYVTTARSANQIILNLSEKNFANAILEAFEMIANLHDKNDFKEIIELTKLIKGITELEWREDLTNVFDLIHEPQLPSSEFLKKNKKKIKENAQIFYRLLSDWETFYIEQLSTEPENAQWKGTEQEPGTAYRLTKTKELMWYIYKGDHLGITTEHRECARKLIKDDYFGKIILSYYAQSKSEIFITQLICDRLANLKVLDRAGNEAVVFNSTELDELKKSMEKYVEATIGLIFSKRSDIKNAEKAFTEANSELTDFILRYIGNLDTKLRIDPNSEVFKLIHFLNDMAQSENAEDIQNAIENFALPSGSFVIKRQSVWTLSVDSYPGFIFGGERAVDRYSGAPAPAAAIGFTAPIGLTLAFGSKQGKCGSFGLFLPVIDIGAFTKFRFDPANNSSSFPEITFKNVFSPGAYFVWGIPKTPISVNLGLQYGPEIRSLNDDGSIANRYEAYRIGGALTLDIPLFKIYTQPRVFNKRKK